MALTERLAILITADTQGAVRDIQKVGTEAERSLGRAASRTEEMSANLTRFGAAAVGVTAVATVGLAGLARASADLGETVNATTVVFGDASDEVVAFADDAASSLGQSKRAALEAASTFGTLFKATGASEQVAADASITFTKLASDLASLRNTSPEDAVEALAAALRGEAEPIRRYGVLLDDATLKQRALSLGLIETTTGTLPPAIRAQAAYAEVLAQTTDAQGDFARTADSLPNQQRRLTAEWENLTAAVGEGVLPTATAAVTKLADLLDAVGNLPAPVKSAAGTFAVFGTAALGTVGTLSLVAGQALKFSERFYTVTESADGATRSLNTFGRAAKGVGVAVGVAGAVLALGAAIEAAGRAAGYGGAQFEGFADKVGGDAVASFDRAVSTIEQAEQVPVDLVDAWEGAVDNIRRWFGQDVPEAASATEEAFRSILSESGLAGAQAVFTALEEAGRDVSALRPILDDAVNAQARMELASATAAAAVEEEKAALAGLPAAGQQAERTLYASAAAAEEAAKRFDELRGAVASAFTDFVDPSDVISDLQRSYITAADAIDDTVESQRAITAAQRSARDAARSLTDAQDAYNDVLREGNARLVADAQRDYRHSLLDVADAADRVADAQERLDRLQREAASGLTSVNAELALADAKERQAEAQQKLDSGGLSERERLEAERDLLAATLDAEDAQKRLSGVQAAGGSDARGIAAAQREVEQATLDAEAATVALADAQKALAEAVSGATFGERLAEAAEQVEAASERYGDALSSITEAQAATAEAQATAVGDATKRVAEEAEVNIEDFIGSLEESVAAQQAWKDNLWLLAQQGRGGLALELAQMGPEAAGLVAQAVNLSDAEAQKLEGLLKQSGDRAGTEWGNALTTYIAGQQFGEAVRGAGAAIGDALAQGVIGHYDSVVGVVKSVLFGDESRGGSGTFGGTRASGGPVAAGNTYLVGERGPELVVPRSSGTVLDAGRTAALTQPQNVTVNVDGSGFASDDAIRLAARVLAWELRN